VKERHVPYFATASLRKVIDSLDFRKYSITRLKAKVNHSEVMGENEYTDIGMTVTERATSEVDIDYVGGGLYLNRLESRLDAIEPHDISIDEVRIRAKADDEIKEAIKRPWTKKDGTETDILEQISLDGIEKCYVDFENEKVDFDWEYYNVSENRTFEEFWRGLNKCGVCGKPLEAHGFVHSTLKAKSIDFPWIRATLKKSQRPEINPFINVIAKWIFHNIVKPTGLNSPNGMFNYRLGKEEQWILEGV